MSALDLAHGSADALAEAAAAFVEARRARPRWRDVPARHRPAGLLDGYRLQSAVHERLETMGYRRLGYKIGATSQPGQTAFGLHEPVYAGIFADTGMPTLRDALSMDLVDPALECEIAVRLGADLDARRGSPGRERILEAIDTCHLACEIVDRRYGDPFAIGVPTLLADDFFHAAFVLGPPQPRWRELDLADLRARTTVGGVATRGTSHDVLDPLAALQWLSGALACVGTSLKAGETVLTGSIVVPVPLRRPAPSVSISIVGFEPLVCSA